MKNCSQTKYFIIFGVVMGGLLITLASCGLITE